MTSRLSKSRCSPNRARWRPRVNLCWGGLGLYQEQALCKGIKVVGGRPQNCEKCIQGLPKERRTGEISEHNSGWWEKGSWKLFSHCSPSESLNLWAGEELHTMSTQTWTIQTVLENYLKRSWIFMKFWMSVNVFRLLSRVMVFISTTKWVLERLMAVLSCNITMVADWGKWSSPLRTDKLCLENFLRYNIIEFLFFLSMPMAWAMFFRLVTLQHGRHCNGRLDMESFITKSLEKYFKVIQKEPNTI